MTAKLRNAEYLRDYKIRVMFDDGKEGVIDLEHELWGEVFEPLKDIRVFQRFRLDSELETIVWPNGADLAPEYLYENAAVGSDLMTVGFPLDQPFFPVSKVRVRAVETGHKFRRHWAVVSDDRKEIFSIVTEDYRLVSNAKACELGGRAFALVFGDDAASQLRIFNVAMPSTRSWAHIDLTAENLAFSPIDGDRWLPFLRVSNSYNRSRALGFAVGLCRWICTNGVIFGERSFKLTVTHSVGVDLESRLDDAFRHQRFDGKRYGERLARLRNVTVPTDQFVAGMLEVLDVRVPDSYPRQVAQRNGWSKLGAHFRDLGRKYEKELGENAYALVSAASDYASDSHAPLMSPTRMHSLQIRCGGWTDKIILRLGTSKPSATWNADTKNVIAAARLMSWPPPTVAGP